MLSFDVCVFWHLSSSAPMKWTPFNPAALGTPQRMLEGVRPLKGCDQVSVAVSWLGGVYVIIRNGGCGFNPPATWEY